MHKPPQNSPFSQMFYFTTKKRKTIRMPALNAMTLKG